MRSSDGRLCPRYVEYWMWVGYLQMGLVERLSASAPLQGTCSQRADWKSDLMDMSDLTQAGRSCSLVGKIRSVMVEAENFSRQLKRQLTVQKPSPATSRSS